MQSKLIVSVALLTLAAAVPIYAVGDIARTADAKPDFSGTYDISSLTPFQRPETFGERLFLTQDVWRHPFR